ncbi:MAG: oxygen-independent coproporphyrinogen III oxidase [Bacteroidota bacterium]|nr:oxygen-independent coproporphyrinogen III oxidase [Bacteroidota bacterium]
MSNMHVNYELIKKYDKPGPRYTSYPPATFFNNGFTSNDFRQHVIASNSQHPRNLSFYFHVPFCPQLCHFCGCNTDVMKGKSFIARYVEAMKNEFETVTQFIDKDRPVTQIHWGGGTPNSISMDFVAEIMALITSKFSLAPSCEIAMECNPAYLTYSQIDKLAELGFNRLSLGIQDFNPEVLNLVNRKPSQLPVADVVNYLRTKNIGVNLDFIYGLPAQTPESFDSTIRQAAQISPDRIVTFSYAHVPWVKSAQKVLEQYEIPGPEAKLAMFEKSYNILVDNGYEAIGLDHFAKPSDSMTVALKNRTLQRNFMGYCTAENTGQVYAFGSTGISQLWDAYSQNVKNTEAYVEAALKDGFAIEKGYRLSARDLVCRAVIQDIMCNGYVNLENVANNFALPENEIVEMLNFNPQSLQPLVDDGLIIFDGRELTVLPEGRMFMRNVAMLFDPLFTGKETMYSKTV